MSTEALAEYKWQAMSRFGDVGRQTFTNTVDNHSHLRLNALMVICVCNALSESDIRQKAAEGLRNFDALRAETGCSDCCGCCESVAREVFAEAQADHGAPFALPLAIAAAA